MDTMECKKVLQSMEFNEEEIAHYEKLIAAGEGSKKMRLVMIQEKRKQVLEQIHSDEEIIAMLDMLRNEIKN